MQGYTKVFLTVLLVFVLSAGCLKEQEISTPKQQIKLLSTVSQLTVLSYDDGAYEGKMAFTSGNATLVVRFTPSEYPYTLHSVSFYIADNPQEFIIRILDDDGLAGGPGSWLVEPIRSIPAGIGWHNVNITLTVTGGDVYVGLMQEGVNESWVGSDYDAPYDGRSWVNMNGSWIKLSDIGYDYDLGIRITGSTPQKTSTTSTLAPTSLSTSVPTTLPTSSVSTSVPTTLPTSSVSTSVPTTLPTTTSSTTSSSSTSTSSTLTSTSTSTTTSTLAAHKIQYTNENCHITCKRNFESEASRCYQRSDCIMSAGIWVRQASGDWDCITANPNRIYCCCEQNDAIEIYHDDGSFEGKVGFSDAGGELAVRFKPSGHPFEVKGVKFFVFENPAPFEIRLYSANEYGEIGVNITSYTLTSPEEVGWHLAPLRATIHYGDFFVGLKPTGNKTLVGVDYNPPISKRGWINLGGDWISLDMLDYEYDLGIRVFGKAPVIIITTTSTSTSSTSTTSTSTSSIPTTTTILLTSQPLFKFKLSDGICGRARPSRLTPAEGGVIFEGSIKTDTPCYTLSSMIYVDNENLTVKLSKELKDEACIYCNAEIPFRVEITDLVSGTYSVTIQEDDQILFTDSVYVRVTNPETGLVECQNHADCPKESFGPYSCVNYRVVRSNYYLACIDHKCVDKVRNDYNSILKCKDIVSITSSGFVQIEPIISSIMPYANGSFKIKFANKAYDNASEILFAGACRGYVQDTIRIGKLLSVDLVCPGGISGDIYSFDVKIIYKSTSGNAITYRTDDGTLRGVYI